MPKPQIHIRPNLGVHNLSSQTLTSEILQLLQKGLSFSPTPHDLTNTQHVELLKRFDDFSNSLRLMLERHHQKTTYHHPHLNIISPYTHETDYINRRMKFLPQNPRPKAPYS